MRTALCVLQAMRDRELPFSEMTRGFTRYPQVLMNVKVREKLPFDSLPGVATASREVEKELDGNGRLLLRYSGTENLARVMIEGKHQATIEAQAKYLADVIESEIGSAASNGTSG
jgi:phosphoglucosamine mutase